MEAQLFLHTRDVGIVQIGTIKVVQEVHKTTECEDEEVELLHQLPLSGRILLASKVLDEAVRHS